MQGANPYTYIQDIRHSHGRIAAAFIEQLSITKSPGAHQHVQRSVNFVSLDQPVQDHLEKPLIWLDDSVQRHPLPPKDFGGASTAPTSGATLCSGIRGAGPTRGEARRPGRLRSGSGRGALRCPGAGSPREPACRSFADPPPLVREAHRMPPSTSNQPRSTASFTASCDSPTSDIPASKRHCIRRPPADS